MDINNRIQALRKSQNMSQEELGEKMLVSRQTVSQWENGQTMPSIESLLKLRELFGVSVDEILGVASDESRGEEKENGEAVESYSFCYDEKELKRIYSHNIKDWIRVLIIVAVLTVATLIGACSEGSYVMTGLFSAFAVGLVLSVKALIDEKRSINKIIATVPKRKYSYSVADGMLNIRITENGKLISEEHKEIEAIERIIDVDAYYVLVIAERSHAIRKSDLKSDSKLLLYIKAHASVKTVPSSGERKLRALSVLAVILSVLAIFGGLMASTLMADSQSGLNNMTDSMWVMFLFLPIPISSVVLGFVLKKKGLKFKKNIVVGVIACALLCVFGCFTFIFADISDALRLVQSEMNIQLPEHGYGVTNEVAVRDREKYDGLTMCEISFAPEGTAEFAETMDERWLTELSSELNGLLAVNPRDYSATHLLVYNADTKAYNKTPERDGEYSMVLMLFSQYSDRLYVFEYDYICKAS